MFNVSSSVLRNAFLSIYIRILYRLGYLKQYLRYFLYSKTHCQDVCSVDTGVFNLTFFIIEI